jgi:hypothetical protein
MKCFITLIISCVVAKSSKANPAFKEINKGDLGTSINFGLQSLDCASIKNDCHKCAISNCKWQNGKCTSGSFSNGAADEMLIMNFFKNAEKCEDKLGVCTSSGIKDDLPKDARNSTGNFTMGYAKPADTKVKVITIPEFYFCYQNVNNWNHKRDSYFALNVDNKAPNATVLLLNEHIITGRLDPLPPKLTFWNNAGIAASSVSPKKLDHEWFVSNLTSQVEVLWINMVPRTQEKASKDFSLKFI